VDTKEDQDTGNQWVEEIIQMHRNGFENVQGNYVCVLLDLTLYKHPNLVNLAFELLMRYFSSRKRLVDMLS